MHSRMVHGKNWRGKFSSGQGHPPRKLVFQHWYDMNSTVLFIPTHSIYSFRKAEVQGQASIVNYLVSKVQYFLGKSWLSLVCMKLNKHNFSNTENYTTVTCLWKNINNEVQSLHRNANIYIQEEMIMATPTIQTVNTSHKIIVL